MDAPKPRPASYYYRRCFILHLILEPWTLPQGILPSKFTSFFQRRSRRSSQKSDDQGSKGTLFFAYVRFLLVLSAWLAVLYIACDHYGILKTIPGFNGKNIVGLLDDKANYGIFLWMILGMALLLLVLRKLDAALLSFLIIIDCAQDPKEFDRLVSEVEHAREFIAIRTRGARWLYGLLMATSTCLVLWYALAMALLHKHTAHSWALEPEAFPAVFVLAQPWAYFWVTVVFAHFIWFTFCIIYFVFWRISVYASRKKVFVPPVSTDERGGLRAIAELVFMVVVLSSGGIMIVIGWHLVFEEIDAHVRFVINLYVAILILLYVLPIWYLKTALKYSRERHLATWGALLAAVYSGLAGSATLPPKPESPSAGIEAIKTNLPFVETAALENIYARVEKMPRSPVPVFVNILATLYLSTPLIPTMLTAIKGQVGQFMRALFGLS